MPVWTRYPWLCGYLVAPTAFHFVSQSAPFYTWAAPLLGETTFTTTTLALCWHFHFLRRALEVVFLNVYHGKGIPNERDSVLEFAYYLTWGVINGCTASCVAQNKGEDSESLLVIPTIGLVLFLVGQAGNFYCHAHLRSLRPSTTDSQWVIPQQFPFSMLAAPHYTFEILSWLGYGLVAGLAPPALFILGVSIVTLAGWGSKRKQKYIKMYKDGRNNKDHPSPENRWVLIPFVY